MSSHPPLIILSTAEAGMLLRPEPSISLGGAISIHGLREPQLERQFRRHLDLQFDDAIELDPKSLRGRSQQLRQRRLAAMYNTPIAVPPTKADVERVIHFAERVINETDPFLIHCAAGISRSPAVALVCLVTWGEADIAGATEVYRQRPMAQLHSGIIRYADEILGKRGDLIRAVQSGQRAP